VTVMLMGESRGVFTTPTTPTWPLQQQQRRSSSRSPAVAGMSIAAQAGQRQQHLSHGDAYAHCARQVGGDARRLAADLSGGGGSTETSRDSHSKAAH
jgi:hypothetical protein